MPFPNSAFVISPFFLSSPDAPFAMSTQSAIRTRSQKHANTSKWKPDKFKTDERSKKVQAAVVTNCCARCTEVIQWKIE